MLSPNALKPFLHEKGFEFAVGMKNVSHEDIVLSLSWAPDGKKLASAGTKQSQFGMCHWNQLVGIQIQKDGLPRCLVSHGDQVAFGAMIRLYTCTAA